MSNKFNTSSTFKTVRTIISEVKGDEDGCIDINPHYQRNVIWSDVKQGEFIDSVLSGIVPNNLIFNVDNESGKQICIDGKQRITSLIRFKENEIPVFIEKEIYYFSRLPSSMSKAKILEKRAQTTFLERNIPVVSYTDLSYRDQILVFHKLQNGVSLSSGELIPSLFTSDQITNNFIKMCDSKIEQLSRYVKEINRKDHYVLVVDIIYMIDNKFKGIPDKTKRDEYLVKLDEEKANRLFSLIFDLIDIYFGVDLFGSSKLLKLNKNMLLSLVYVIYSKFELNLSSTDKELIIEVINNIQRDCGSKFGSKTTQKIVSDIITEFEKRLKGKI